MTIAKRRARPGALTAQHWIAAAGAALEAGGIDAVAVEPLAQRLGVTKGSFYWHFANRDALLQATLERWEAECTEAVIAAVARIEDPRERLAALIVEALTDTPEGDRAGDRQFVFSHAADLAIADAAADPIVQPILRRVTERRIDYLEECYCGLGLSPAAARHHALLAYAAYLGTLRLAREIPSRLPRDEAYLAYQRHLIATLLPEKPERNQEQAQPLPATTDVPDAGGERVTSERS